MRKVLPLLSAMLILGATAAAAVTAQGKDWGPIPPHAHVMLIGAEIGAGGITYDKCVDFAAGKTLSTTAHHAGVHTGAAGGSPFVQGALFNAGKVVVPMAPLTPFTGCASIPNPLPFE